MKWTKDHGSLTKSRKIYYIICYMAQVLKQKVPWTHKNSNQSTGAMLLLLFCDMYLPNIPCNEKGLEGSPDEANGIAKWTYNYVGDIPWNHCWYMSLGLMPRVFAKSPSLWIYSAGHHMCPPNLKTHGQF